MVLEWSVIYNIFSILVLVIPVTFTYIRTWAKFESTVSNLDKVVTKLSEVVDGVKAEQVQVLQRVSRVETKQDDIDKRVENLEVRFDNRRKG